MTKTYVNLISGANTAPAPWSYNGFSTTTVGVLTSDLNDDSNAATGWQLEVTTGFAGSAGAPSNATSGAGSWTDNEPFDYFFYVGGTGGQLKVSGLPVGYNYTLEAAGHRSPSSTGRNTDFTVNSVTELYEESGSGTPTAPVSFTGTVPAGGELTIDVDIGTTGGGSFCYIDGFTLEVTASGPVISATTDPTVDQVQSSITTTGLTTATSASLGGDTITLGGTIPNLTYTYDTAAISAEESVPRMGETVTLSVTGAEGTATSSVVTAVKAGWAFVTLTSVDRSSGSLIEWLESDLSKTTAIGDQLYYNAADSTVITAAGSLTTDSSSFDLVLIQGGSATVAGTGTPATIVPAAASSTTRKLTFGNLTGVKLTSSKLTASKL